MDGSFINNELYIGQRLLFSQDQPQATAAFLDIAGDELWLTMKAAWFKGFVFALAVTPLAFLIARAGSDAWGLAVLLWLVAWTVPWFLRDHLYAGHWELLLEDQAAVVESVFAFAYQHLRDKGSPAVLRPRRLVSVIGGESRYYLTVTQGHYVAYIAVMPYGKDLFVSWTMWRELFPIAMVLRWLVERLSALVGKGSTFHQIVRSDPARAMREAVHNATRAGAELAIKGNRATVHGTFGTTLPQETIDDRIAMVSAGWPPKPPTPTSAPAGQPPSAPTGTYPFPHGHGAQPSAAPPSAAPPSAAPPPSPLPVHAQPPADGVSSTTDESTTIAPIEPATADDPENPTGPVGPVPAEIADTPADHPDDQPDGGTGSR